MLAALLFATTNSWAWTGSGTAGYEEFTQVQFVEEAGVLKGFKIGNKLYTSGTEIVNLTLAGSEAGYAASTGTLTGTDNPYTLQMVSANSEISPAGIAVTAKPDPQNPADPGSNIHNTLTDDQW